jgi:puromycin-sensitive aminopeptidase
MNISPNPYRLARTVVPSAYRIFITPNLDGATFAGRVEIDVDVHESASRLTLNSLDLELGAATLTAAGVSYRSVDTLFDATYETATFVFERDLPVGPAVLEVAFTGVLNDMLVGFYRSTYVDPQGVTHTIATTQFENSDARRAFPCWDEPSFKSTYQVNLTVPSELAAYSNSPVTSDVDLGNGQRTISFATTMVMSTYLVAFIVGAFDETAERIVDGVPIRIVYPIGKGHLTDVALDASAFALHFFNEYFDISYPGQKLDMVAIPDFAFGAMENLGCVTYRESALLVDPATASLTEIERTATVIAHEIAHMWFGDLVTMAWWEGIWLNEAFATFMEVLCTDAYMPAWKMWVGFGVDRDAALQVDGLHSTRPIEFEVISPDDMRGMFDVLTYEKGGSVLRMLEQYLGADVYRDGIRHYLRRHSYANTVTTDLWDALEEVSGQPVREMMNTWILQGGHPLVTLDEGEIRQEPFSYGAVNAQSAIGSTWLVPVHTRALGSSRVTKHLLGDEAITVDDDGPIVINAGGVGTYRSRYAPRALAKIAPRIAELDELERATLVADSWAMLFSGRSLWSDFLDIARGLGDHDEPTPWGTVATAFDFVYRALRDDQRGGFIEIVHEVFGPQFDRLGWDERESDSELTPPLRSIVISTLGTIGADKSVQDEAVSRFETDEMGGDLARAIMRIAAAQNRLGTFETFLDRYHHAPTPQVEQRYQRGLAEFNDVTIALDTADRCFVEFRNQDGPIVLGSLMRNAVAGPSVWTYVTDRWEEALTHFPPSMHSTLTLGVPFFITDPAFAERVTAFHATHRLTAEQRTVDQQIERMHVGLAFTAAMRLQF